MRDFRRGPRRNFGRGGGGFNRFGPREMHKTTCAECGKKCEVPFKPTEGRPVYCKECFMKRKGIEPREESKEEKAEETEESEEETEEPEEEKAEESEDEEE